MVNIFPSRLMYTDEFDTIRKKLVYIDGNDNTCYLSLEQKDVLFSILETQKNLSCTEAAKRIGLPSGGYFPEEKYKKQKLNGNETSCDMRKPECFGSLWDGFSEEKQDNIIEDLITNNSEEEIEKKDCGIFPIRFIAKKHTCLYFQNCCSLLFGKTHAAVFKPYEGTAHRF